MIKKICLVAVIICGYIICSNSAYAQGDVSGLIKAGPDDASKLAQAYLTPLFKGFGIGLNSGWNTSGRAKNVGRFEIRAGITGALIPDADKSFDVTRIGLSDNIRPVNSSQIMAPTVGSSSDSGPQMAIYDDNDNEVERFTLPGGANLPFIPAPQIQASIGLPKGIELTLRTMPKINLGDDRGSIGMLGGGVKVELLPLFMSKTADRLIPVDVALAAGYTQFNYKLPLSVDPPSGAPRDPDQMIDAKFSGLNLEAIVSKKLLFFTPFLSVGYHSAKTDARLKGDYEFTTGGSILGPTYTTFTDPVTIKRNDISGVRTNMGFQLNLAVFRIYASYTLAEYNAFNAGIGLGIGK